MDNLIIALFIALVSMINDDLPNCDSIQSQAAEYGLIVYEDCSVAYPETVGKVD